MTQQIQDILAALVTLENTLGVPSGASKAAVATDEPPDTFNTFPLFLNLEVQTRPEDLRAFGSGNGLLVHAINAYLLFAPADQKYSIRDRRLWTLPVLQLFETDSTNLGGACALLKVLSIEYGAVSIGGQDFIATTFRLAVTAGRT